MTFFGTGFGPLVPALPDNLWTSLQSPLPSLITQPQIYIRSPVPSGGAGMPVLYAGPAPGQLPGIYQINAQIPELASTGNVQIQLSDLVNGQFYRSTLQNLWIAVK